MTTYRFRATIEYDGTNYLGFQRQRPEVPTIQGALEATLSALRSERVAVLGAGRTDSGVHALGQVVAFDMTWRHGTEALMRAANANLPPDIAVVDLAVADSNFHPRYDARSRLYQYRLWSEPVPSPTRARYTWHVPGPLDVHAMNRASSQLLGTRDFATFGRPPQGTNTVRRVMAAGWRKLGSFLMFDIEADAFLYRMVRSLVGSLVLVGQGRLSPSAFAEALDARERQRGILLAPACGLFLMSVTYE